MTTIHKNKLLDGVYSFPKFDWNIFCNSIVISINSINNNSTGNHFTFVLRSELKDIKIEFDGYIIEIVEIDDSVETIDSVILLNNLKLFLDLFKKAGYKFCCDVSEYQELCINFKSMKQTVCAVKNLTIKIN